MTLLSDLSYEEQVNLVKSLWGRTPKEWFFRVTHDTEKLIKDSIVKITYGEIGTTDIGVWVCTSRSYSYFLDGDELHILEFSDETKLVTAKREKPWPKPEMVEKRVFDSTGQEILPGDYVIMSHHERLLHVKYVKQTHNTMFQFQKQSRKDTFRRRLQYKYDNQEGTVELPESLKIHKGTLDHLMMRKLQGLA